MNNRKAINFYRSYYEVTNKLPLKYRWKFVEALLKYQFEGVEPSDLKGIDLAWTSVKHSLDKQLQGFKHGQKGGRPPKGTSNPPPKGTSNQEQEQEQEKGQYANKRSTAKELYEFCLQPSQTILGLIQRKGWDKESVINFVREFIDTNYINGGNDMDVRRHLFNSMKKANPEDYKKPQQTKNFDPFK